MENSNFKNECPSALAEELYNILKSKYNIVQVGICGEIVSLVSQKHDAAIMKTYLEALLPERMILQKKLELTQLVCTYTLPKNNIINICIA